MARNIVTIVNQDKKIITLTDKVSGNAISINTTTDTNTNTDANILMLKLAVILHTLYYYDDDNYY